MKYRVTRCAVASSLVAIVLGVAPAHGAVVAAPACTAVLSDISGAPQTTKLFGLDVVARNDAWAVGESSAGAASSTLIEHWDGTSWSVSPSPSVPGALFRVEHLSPTNVWAVGRQGGSQVVSEHWNGTAWTVVPMPTPTGAESYMLGLAIRSADDIWAVGFTGSGP
jgi:hypothetical protein